MNDDTLLALLRTAIPPIGDAAPSRDLWPLVAGRAPAPARWWWVDAALAAAVALALLARPDWLLLLAYHL